MTTFTFSDRTITVFEPSEEFWYTVEVQPNDKPAFSYRIDVAALGRPRNRWDRRNRLKRLVTLIDQ